MQKLFKILCLIFCLSLLQAADVEINDSSIKSLSLSFDNPSEKTGVHITFETERLIISSSEPCDLLDYINCFSDSYVYKPYGCGIVEDEALKKSFDDFMRYFKKGNPASIYSIKLKNNDLRIAGFIIATYNSDYGALWNSKIKVNQEAEISIAIKTDFQRKGIGREGLGAFIRAFTELLVIRSNEFQVRYQPSNLRKLWAIVTNDNVPSQNLLSMVGFQQDDRGEYDQQIRYAYTVPLKYSKL